MPSPIAGRRWLRVPVLTLASALAMAGAAAAADMTVRQVTEAFFAALKANDAQVLGGNRQVAQAVGAGRLAFGLTDTDDALGELAAGSPVAIVYPDREPGQLGTLFIPNTLARIKGSPHPDAAEALAAYLLSPEVETALALGRASLADAFRRDRERIAKAFRQYILEPLARERWRRIAIEELRRMDDRLLADIGLRRDQIDIAVHGLLAQREGTDVRPAEEPAEQPVPAEETVPGDEDRDDWPKAA